MYATILMFIKLNNFDTQRLNGPRNLFYSFCCTTRSIFEPLRVYEPGFNTDKYGILLVIAVLNLYKWQTIYFLHKSTHYSHANAFIYITNVPGYIAILVCSLVIKYRGCLCSSYMLAIIQHCSYAYDPICNLLFLLMA